MHRKPCLRALSYSTCPVAARPDTSEEPPGSPIRVADKNKCRCRIKNDFIDDRGFPDQSDEYDTLLHIINDGPVLRKLKHHLQPLNVVDPLYSFKYNESIHGDLLCKHLDLSQLGNTLQDRIYALVRKYWAVFNDRGVFVPVKNYKCVIDTGNAPPIAVKKIQYGLKEIPIMHRAITALEKVGHILQIHDRRWLFKAVLAPKPHQEHVCHIDDFVWHFCGNYIPLNAVTQIIAYLIPHCNLAVSKEFGTGLWMWLYDAPSGYHQLASALASQKKLAFQGPDAIKWTYMVMPFGPTNDPAAFVNFIYNVDSQWESLACSHGISIDDKPNTCIIVDDIVSHGQDLKTSVLYMEC
jgi:hypothetical protein